MSKKELPAAKQTSKRSPRKGLTKSGQQVTVKLKRPRVPKRPKSEVDDPVRRFGELFQDRQFGSKKTEKLAHLRLAAIEASRALSPFNETNTTPATSGGSNWVELGPTAVPNGQTYSSARVLVSGRVTEIVQDPTNPLIIYLASARGGVWKTVNGGLTWSPMSDNAASLAIGALAISKSNPQVLYAGTGEGDIYYYRLTNPLGSVNAAYEGAGVLKSINGGTSWVLQGQLQFTGACFYKIAVNPTNPNIVFGATNQGLFRTTNGGATWTKLTSGLPAISSTTIIACCDIVIHPTNPSVAYCAFWAKGIYKTTNASAATPNWTLLAGGLPTSFPSPPPLPPSSLQRISLAISPTAPNNVYAMIANAFDSFGGFYTSANGGSTWSLASSSPLIQVYGAYTSNIFVDISTPDIVYLSGVSLHKATRTGGTWTVSDVGTNIHPDNHAFACHPTNHLVIYAGTDGGIYKSNDGGSTWDDSVNKGMNIMQFEFLGQHPTSDAKAIAGTQDNGTQMFRNHPAFYLSANGDGGVAVIDQAQPINVLHTYYGNSPERSTLAGKWGDYTSPVTHLNWTDVSSGIQGGGLFYPPMTLDDTNQNNIAFGTDCINLDAAQGTGGWPTKVTLPGIGLDEYVSAIHYVNSSLIYAATSSGQVYLLTHAASWTAKLISTSALPGRWIWDISALPGNPHTVIVVMAGFGTPHVWKGVGAGPTFSTFTWTNISGTGSTGVPDVPVNALVIDPLNATHFYIGTDIGVFRTTNSGSTWQLFSDGLPNTAVYDLRLHASTRLLRAATHGRGLWERLLDVTSMKDVDLYVRDNLMSTGRIVPTPPLIAAFEDPLQYVSLGDPLFWWQCADAKIDSPAPTTHNYQYTVANVDYLVYETLLQHTDTQRGVTNRVYVQIHNRGIKRASQVTVKILYADASPSLPDLPSNFWTTFPNNGDQTHWKAIGAPKVIPYVSPRHPEILEWDWVPPVSAASHSCLLIVVDCPDDPIPPGNKVFDIGTLVTREKRVGLKNLHVIGALPAPYWSALTIYGRTDGRDTLRLQGLPAGWSVGVLFPEEIADKLKLKSVKRPTATRKQITKKLELKGLRRITATEKQKTTLQEFLRREVKVSELKHFYALTDPKGGAEIANIPRVKNGFPLLLVVQAGDSAKAGSFSLIQTAGQAVIGGNTFVLRARRK